MRVIDSYTDYQIHVGSHFLVVDDAGQKTGLELTNVALRHDTAEQLVFSLSFSAPPPLLPQSTYPLQHDKLGELYLFLVPIGQTKTGFRYEAIFNLPKDRD